MSNTSCSRYISIADCSAQSFQFKHERGQILEYNDLDTSRVRRQYQKLIGFLEKDDFYSADVMRPIRLPLFSVNQRLPSGPAVIPNGPLPPVMPVENSVIVTAVACNDIDKTKVKTKAHKTRQKRIERTKEIPGNILFSPLNGLYWAWFLEEQILLLLL